MAVLDWITPEPALTLHGEKVRLRPPRMGDYRAWSDLRRISRDFLQPWEPTWPEDDLSRASFRRRLSIYTRDLELAQGYAFFVFRRSDDRLVGGVNLRDVRRGVAQMGALGYWVGQPYARSGYTLDGVKAVCNFGFRQLGLHRLEAACLPENEASHRLLLRAGFEQEGLARAYLKINGRWADHLLFGMINPTS
jgi:ribosomal-protein-alanine N-acetyltransferase